MTWRVVPPASHRIPRARRYSGYALYCRVFVYVTVTPYGLPSHAVLLTLSSIPASATPIVLLHSVWSLSLSLAATKKISFDYSSSAYLDVSVQRVPYVWLWIHHTLTVYYYCRVSPFGNLWVAGYLLLSTAYRSLSRPSSAPDAKAFALCSFSLELPIIV